MEQKIIGLDETGIFERGDDNFRMIGGFVKYSRDPLCEEKRLETFFRDLCRRINEEMGWVDSEYELVYPYSLHLSAANIFAKEREDGSLTELSRDSRGKIKARYSRQRSEVNERILGEVLSYMKTNGYELYALLDGTGEEKPASFSNLLDFDVAGNRYERLAILAVYNQIFYQVAEEMPRRVDLHLATRTIQMNAEETDAVEEARRLYDERESTDERIRYFANTTTSTFKTALADKLYESGGDGETLDVTFHVEAANYRDPRRKCQPYLYLADLACHYLRRELRNKTFLRVKEDCELPVSFWVYGEVDRQWRQAVEKYRNGSLSECFLRLFDLNQGEGPVYDYYRKYWCDQLEKRILQELSASGEEGKKRRRQAFARMPAFLSDVEQDIMRGDRERACWLAEKMKALLEKMMEAEPGYRDRGQRLLFRINDQLLRGMNYRGAVDGLREYIRECDKYRNAVQMEEYIDHVIRVLQYYFNSYQFEKALEVGAQLDGMTAKLLDAYREYARAGTVVSGEILGIGSRNRKEEPVCLAAAGRLHSTLGQACGFLGKYSQARRYFALAEEEFGPGENCRITQCHELQLYLDQKKEAEYEQLAREVLGTGSLWEQWHRLEDGLPGTCYLLQAYVKGLRMFYAGKPDQEYLIKNVISRLTDRTNKGHPWQIIYKNLYEIVCMTGYCPDRKEMLQNRMLTCVQPEPCLEIMVGYYRILAAREEKTDVKEAICALRDRICRYGLEGSFAAFLEMDPEREKGTIYSYLTRRIRYEYT